MKVTWYFPSIFTVASPSRNQYRSSDRRRRNTTSYGFVLHTKLSRSWRPAEIARKAGKFPKISRVMGRILTKKGGRVVLNEQVKSQKETGKLCLKVELQSLHDMQDSTRQT